MTNNHTTTIVVDFDDTLSFTKNRDWENAEPNQPLIDRLNQLFDTGWTIHIVTARGQLSCNGNCDAADNKYRKQIEAWLNKHGVKYTDLSFQKKLAAYYIDDKGCHPDDFIAKFGRQEMRGMSGSEVYYDSMTKLVYKTDKKTPSVVEWYNHATSLGFRVPKINTVIGDTISMEFIEPAVICSDMADVLKIVSAFAKHPPLHIVDPFSYVDRCALRVKDALTQTEYHDLRELLIWAMAETPASFSHGDFSCSNIIYSSNCEHVMIDPISDPTLFSSYIIDAAKLKMSIMMQMPGYSTIKRHELLSDLCRDNRVLDIHVLGHLCRVYPYTTEKERYLSHIRQMLQELNCVL